MIAIELIFGAVTGVVVATLIEYVVHRAMHWGYLYPEGHARHHASGDPRTYFRDFLDYGTGGLMFGWLGFLLSTPLGIGGAIGTFIYVVLASYAHQLQHADGSLVFWMPRPVHRLHHDLDMTDRNFGILVDWWDRLFGTYVPIEAPRRRAPARDRLKGYFAIPWC
jgi:sterol desaturase/sphingolipid hydroxylase (fatty acid hydroxylase superfamily)